MGLLIDTDVWVLAEKAGDKLNLARWVMRSPRMHGLPPRFPGSNVILFMTCTSNRTSDR